MRKVSLPKMLYYFSIGLYFVLATLGQSMLGQSDTLLTIIKYGKYICAFIVLIKILVEKKITKKRLFIWSIGILITGIVYIKMGANLPIILIVLLLGANKCDGKAIGKIYLATVGTIVVLSTIASQMGIVEDRIFYRADGTIRHSMGMNYATVWAAFIFFLTAVYIYIKRDTIKKFVYAIALVFLSGLIYTLTSSLIEAFLLICLLLCILFSNRLLVSKWFKILCKISFPLSAIITFCLQYLYMSNTAKYAWLNLLFTQRLSWTAQAITKYGFSLFGTAFRMQGAGTINFDTDFGYFFVDSFFMNYSLQYGLIFMIFISIFICYISFSVEDPWLLLMILFASVHGIIISLIFLPQACPFFVLLYSEYTNPKKRIKISNHNSAKKLLI